MSSIGCSIALAVDIAPDTLVSVDADFGVMPYSLGTTLVSYSRGPSVWKYSFRRNDAVSATTSNLDISGSHDFSNGTWTYTTVNSSSGFYSASLVVPSGAYIDYSLSVNFDAGVYDLSGSLTVYLYTRVSSISYIYPTSVDVYADDLLLVSGVSPSSSGVFSFDVSSLVFSKVVNSIRFRVYYPSGTYSPTRGSSTAFTNVMYFVDSVNFSRQPDVDPTLPILESILVAIRGFSASVSNSLTTIINNIVSSPEKDAVASEFVSGMEEVQDKIDEANQTIEDNTNRPSADALLPATPDIIQDGVIGGGDAAATAMMDDFGSLLASPLILNVLVLVFTLAFLSYVLFGKKG